MVIMQEDPIVIFMDLVKDINERIGNHALESRKNFKEIHDQMHKDKQELIEKINAVNLHSIEKTHNLEMKVASISVFVTVLFSAATEWLKSKFHS